MDSIRTLIRKLMHGVAVGLNTATGGKLHPNVVTITSLIMHLPIAYYTARGKLEIAALLLIIFGLFDTLDGELARLQKRASRVGMLLDSATDRMKEIILYGGLTFYLVSEGKSYFAVWAVIALGGSVLTSYINAWGDVVMAHNNSGNHPINKAFRGGLLTFEIRMFLLVVALLTNQLVAFVVIVGVLAWFTAFQRLYLITKNL